MTQEQQEQLNDKLIEASKQGNLESVKEAIEHGANIHAKENQTLI